MYSTAVSTAAPAPAAFAVRYPTVTFLSTPRRLRADRPSGDAWDSDARRRR
jgi:hypothetical protein